MNQPELKDENDNTQLLPYPTKPTRQIIRQESQNRTLAGTLFTDRLYKKYKYEFPYPDMVEEDYNSIEDFIDNANTLYVSWPGRYSELRSKKSKVWIEDKKDFLGAGQLVSTTIIIEPIEA